MFAGFELNTSKARVIVLSIAGVGLIVGITAFYCQTSTKPQHADTPVSTQRGLSTGGTSRSVQTTDNSQGMAIVSVSPFRARIEEQNTEQPQEPDSKRSRKQKSRASSHKLKLAWALCGGNVGKPAGDAPGGLVEMWSGSKKCVVAVPAGAKFED